MKGALSLILFFSLIIVAVVGGSIFAYNFSSQFHSDPEPEQDGTSDLESSETEIVEELPVEEMPMETPTEEMTSSETETTAPDTTGSEILSGSFGLRGGSCIPGGPFEFTLVNSFNKLMYIPNFTLSVDEVNITPADVVWNEYVIGPNGGTNKAKVTYPVGTHNLTHKIRVDWNFTEVPGEKELYLQCSYSPLVLYDNFNGASYTISQGSYSPNGKWLAQSVGSGTVGTENNFFYLRPSTPGVQTHTPTVLAKDDYIDFNISFDVRTDQQLKTQANNSEVAYIVWGWTSPTHFYYFAQKTNGSEIGYYDGDASLENRIVIDVSNSSPAVIGEWSMWNVTVSSGYASILVDKSVVFDGINVGSTQGKVGLYSRDARVSFDNVYLNPIFPIG